MPATTPTKIASAKSKIAPPPKTISMATLSSVVREVSSVRERVALMLSLTTAASSRPARSLRVSRMRSNTTIVSLTE